MKLLLLFSLLVATTNAYGVDIVCEGRNSKFVMRFESFPDKPQTLTTTIRNKTKTYSIDLCEFGTVDGGVVNTDCRSLPPSTPNLENKVLSIIHEYGEPADTDQLGVMVGALNGKIQGFYFKENWDNPIKIKRCSVK